MLCFPEVATETDITAEQCLKIDRDVFAIEIPPDLMKKLEEYSDLFNGL